MNLHHRFLRHRLAPAIATALLGAAVLQGPAAHAAPAAPPTLDLASVQPGGTKLDGYVITNEPTTIRYSVRQAVVVAPPVGTVTGVAAARLTGVAAPITGVLEPVGPPPVYETKHPFTVKGLKPNTAYDLFVTVTNRTGQSASAQRRFTTLKQRVRVTLESIQVSDDGDAIGSGEPTWAWTLSGFSGGPVTSCYPFSGGHCREGSADGGQTFIPTTPSGKPFQFIFAEENFRPVVNPHPQPGNEDFSSMPTQLTLNTHATESDNIFGSVLDGLLDWGAWLSSSQQLTWTVPQGQESVRDRLAVAADDGNFRSQMHFIFEVFYDNQTYTPNDGRVLNTAK